ncbi:hypothetical protein IQ03_04799 [Gemmobacter caeni]|uniref:Uncharacterized protein n=1 Tax=Gemmobacter caeni TaxID=589035 RepID=A0A2T6AZ76_9RHOB|nr:hypothetical protein [Gemmobacter caeni]PTX49103.1 hypothetical protein C8N34_108213 [Gemmobacter caeni]TWI93440.1 hypothetical protein IQ03_04799 [Gemmobacter caeni]
MKEIINMPGYMGKPWQVTGYAKSGLIVHKMGETWVVSHIVTGCRIGPGTRLKRDAIAKRDSLLGLIDDWTAESVEALGKQYPEGTRAFTDAVRSIAY